MNCQQFQDVLPHIVDSGGNGEEEAHLRSCTDCAIVVQDLRYIADQARLLLPLHDPSPRVWQNIQRSLRNEGMISEGRLSLMGHLTLPSQNLPAQAGTRFAHIRFEHIKSWTPLGGLLAMAALALMAVVLVNYRPVTTSGGLAANPPASPPLNSSDQALVGQVQKQQPVVRAAYEDSLKNVNAYIVDARKAVDDNPEDATAQQHLMDAYDQKAMLYEMATVRALQ
jgi:hypothetical protein